MSISLVGKVYIHSLPSYTTLILIQFYTQPQETWEHWLKHLIAMITAVKIVQENQSYGNTKNIEQTALSVYKQVSDSE